MLIFEVSLASGSISRSLCIIQNLFVIGKTWNNQVVIKPINGGKLDLVSMLSAGFSRSIDRGNMAGRNFLT